MADARAQPTQEIVDVPTVFDPEAGVLRVSHAALSVLATLAVDPTSPSLTDHATAPALAQLRAAGIVGPAGVHPDVRPLAAVIGAPQARFDLDLAERGSAWRAPGWVSTGLVVMAVPAHEVEDGFDLVADVPASAADLLGDLVGLSTGLSDPRALPSTSDRGAPVTADLPSTLRSETLEALLSGETEDGRLAADVPPAVGRLRTALRAHWRLALREQPDATVEVLDAGESGLWIVEGPDAAGTVHLDPADAPRVRAAVAELLRTAQR